MTDALATIAVEDAIERLVTPQGKHIEVVHLSGSNLYRVRFKEGGELPNEYDLRDGRWTSATGAKDAAKAYLRDFWAKVETKRERQEKPLSKSA